MGGLLGFLIIYVFGGLTFIPLLVAAVFLHAYLTFPIRDKTKYRERETDPLIQPGDDVEAIERAQQALGDKFKSRNPHEADVAAGYFAVCREYVPGGVNGKPPERSTPVGSTPVASPSPSVYQSMYRSLFERKPVNSPIDNKRGTTPQKRGGNVFYVVLRHGHLMLFDDDEQLEVRHVISLAHHNVSIYSGEEETPEGELFIKRNALCLSRRLDAGEVTADGSTSKPFFLFSENCSDKEDFYFALLRNQERRSDSKDNPPIPLQYDVKDIITLVQRLHSSEEHLQTRWINAVIGRVFLALYKTQEVENFIRSKITKKISRVKTPSFLSKISLQKVDMGEAAPVITNPRLKDLTVDGELVVEADVKYTGSFRLEVAATARIELGTRFKAREVNLLLAVVLKRIEGHALLRIKPSPSNRFWVTFETMPKIDLHIEPIVSSRQITYTLILRQIENRIKEVVAESLVLPNWDDSPFYHSDNSFWRGGIWANAKHANKHADAETIAAQQGNVDEVEHLDAEHEGPVIVLSPEDKSMSMPTINSPGSAYSRKGTRSAVDLSNTDNTGSSTSIESRASLPEQPRALRSGSFANVSTPVVSTDATNADVFKPSTPPDSSHAMAAISALSLSNSAAQAHVDSPSRNKLGSQSSTSSFPDFEISEKDSPNELTPQPTANNSDQAIASNHSSSHPPSPASLSGASFSSDAQSTRSLGSFGFGRDSRRDTSSSGNSAETKKLSLAAVTNAAATAKQWGWNALQRRNERKTEDNTEPPASPRPLVMGRGQPLPPPGVPLPRPQKTKTAPIPVPKRKPMPPPTMPPKHSDSRKPSLESRQSHPLPPPLLPKRRSREEASEVTDDGLFVVSAPQGDSEPTTPLTEHNPSYVQPWVEDFEESEQDIQQSAPIATPVSPPPRLPKRRGPHRVLSSSPEEDGQKLPSWMAAQEEEARSKTNFVDEDSGLQ